MKAKKRTIEAKRRGDHAEMRKKVHTKKWQWRRIETIRFRMKRQGGLLLQD